MGHHTHLEVEQAREADRLLQVWKHLNPLGDLSASCSFVLNLKNLDADAWLECALSCHAVTRIHDHNMGTVDLWAFGVRYYVLRYLVGDGGTVCVMGMMVRAP